MNPNKIIGKSDEITLTSYLKDNKDLLSILGVFIAIAVFSGNLSIKLIAALISFFSFTCATLILIEFWRQSFKNGVASLGLYFFRIALFLLALSFFGYWFTILDAIYPDMVFFVLFVIIAEVVVLCLKKLKEKIDWIRMVFEILKKRKALKIIFVIILIITILIAARIIANKIELPIFKAVVWIISTSSKIQGPIQ